MSISIKAKQLVLLATVSFTMTACSNVSPPALETLSGNWKVMSIQDKQILTNSSVKLNFSPDNSLSGSASCNNLSSSYQTNNNSLIIAPIATTRKMCLPALMEQESNLLRTLSKVKRYQLNKGELSLYNQQGLIQLKAERVKQ